MPYSTHFHKITLLVVFLACLSTHLFVSVGLAQTGTTKADATQREDESRRPSEPKQPMPAHPTMVNGIPGIDLMKRLGAKFELGVSLREIDNYSNLFDRTDPNRDGQHTKEEYVDGGRYMTPQARAGIFNASDENHDGVVTRSEYVLNRIITDEGKSIIQAMDKNKNGLVESMEFVETSRKRIGNQTLASGFFSLLDRNRDGTIPIPEYLRIWGQLAREGQAPAENRITSQRKRTQQQRSQKENALQPNSDGPPETFPQTDQQHDLPPPRNQANPPSIDEVFQRFDRNQDGTLARDEIAGFASDFILPADLNQDNVVTKQELKSYRKARRTRNTSNAQQKPQP